MYRSLFVISLTLIFLAACRKDKLPAPIDDVGFNHQSHLPLNKGNYWIYENYLVTDSSTTSLNSFDTLRVGSDTIINSIQYTQLIGTVFEMPFKKLLVFDYATNTFVDENQNIFMKFSLERDTINVEQVTNWFVDSIYTICSPDPQLINTPLANFNSEYQLLKHFFTIVGQREENSYFKKDVGIVKITTFYSNGSIREMRLIDYSIH